MCPWTSIFDFEVTTTPRGLGVLPENAILAIIPPCPGNLNFQTKEYVDARVLLMEQDSWPNKIAAHVHPNYPKPCVLPLPSLLCA